MLNQIVLVGILKEVKTVGDVRVLVVDVERNFKNSEGFYDRDLINVAAMGTLAQYAEEIGIGSLVGIKGRLASNDEVVTVVCEKISVLEIEPK